MNDANPLPPCPGTPNCERQSHAFDADAETLFGAVQEVLAVMNPVEVTAEAERYHVDAVFRVIFFRDDLALRVEPRDTGSTLHIRSASRTGRNDFGVNRRRIERFLDTLRGVMGEEG